MQSAFIRKTANNRRLAASAPRSAALNIQENGTWKNQMGSVMQIVVEDVRNIRGTYTSVTKDAQGNTTKVEGNPVLKTLWNLVTEVPNPQEQNFLWLSTLTGADEFTMTTTKKIR